METRVRTLEVTMQTDPLRRKDTQPGQCQAHIRQGRCAVDTITRDDIARRCTVRADDMSTDRAVVSREGTRGGRVHNIRPRDVERTDTARNPVLLLFDFTFSICVRVILLNAVDFVVYDT